MAADACYPSEWADERLRFQLLQLIYDRTGPYADKVVSSREIGTALGLPFDEVLRLVSWLEEHQYIHYFGGGRCVCLSSHGAAYIEERAQRRKSIRA